MSIDPIDDDRDKVATGPFVHTYPYMLLLYDALTDSDHVWKHTNSELD
jgi:hypothetical protein